MVFGRTKGEQMIEITARTILSGLILINALLWIFIILKTIAKDEQKKRAEQDRESWG